MQMMMKFRLGADAETGADTGAGTEMGTERARVRTRQVRTRTRKRTRNARPYNALSEKRGRRGIAVGRAGQGAFLGPYIDGQ